MTIFNRVRLNSQQVPPSETALPSAPVQVAGTYPDIGIQRSLRGPLQADNRPFTILTVVWTPKRKQHWLAPLDSGAQISLIPGNIYALRPPHSLQDMAVLHLRSRIN